MYIKFLAHGKGDPSKASSYLIDEVDHLNRPRPDIQVLRGDPQTFTALAQSIQNDWIYTSGVIAWSKSDNPTDAEVSEVLDEFEKHAFAGLQPEQRADPCAAPGRGGFSKRVPSKRRPGRSAATTAATAVPPSDRGRRLPPSAAAGTCSAGTAGRLMKERKENQRYERLFF